MKRVMRNLYVIILILFGFFHQLNAQSVLKDSIRNCFMIGVNYSAQLPFGDLKKRFGFNSSMGGTLSGKFGKNFIIGIEGAALFGNKLKEDDILDGLLTDEGQLITKEGLYAGYKLSELGFTIQGNFGKIISFKKPNVNSGLLLSVGLGMMQHKIKIEADEGLLPQLDKQYRKGYDRLTNGVSLSEFVGYIFLDPKKHINLYVGVEFITGFTKNRRSWNYDENQKEEGLRKDLLLGFKIGWILPVYIMPTEKYYYY